MGRSPRIRVAVLAIAAMVSIAHAVDTDKKVEVSGDLRFRFERLDNYFDTNGQPDDQFSFWPYRARIGVDARLQENVTFVLQVQNFGSFGNQSPAHSTAPPLEWRWFRSKDAGSK